MPGQVSHTGDPNTAIVVAARHPTTGVAGSVVLLVPMMWKKTPKQTVTCTVTW